MNGHPLALSRVPACNTVVFLKDDIVLVVLVTSVNEGSVHGTVPEKFRTQLQLLVDLTGSVLIVVHASLALPSPKYWYTDIHHVAMCMQLVLCCV